MTDQEKIIDTIYGITKTTKVSSYGNYVDTENSIFVTNKRLLLVSIPVIGEGIAIGGIDISMLQSMFNTGQIRKKGEEMVRTLTPQQIFESNKSNSSLPFEQIDKMKFSKFFRTIKLLDKQGNKFKYTIKKRDDHQRFRDTLSQYIGNKIT